MQKKKDKSVNEQNKSAQFPSSESPVFQTLLSFFHLIYNVQDS